MGVRQLERQLRLLTRLGHRPASAADAADGRPGLHVTFDDAYANVESALPVLESLGLSASVFACSSYADDGRPLAIPELAGEASRHPQELATMDWDALRGLAERGVEIGSHTVSHAHLTRLGDEELARELRTSKERIEEELRRPCAYLAFPYGEEDGRVRAAARAAGYDAAFALPGRSRPRDRFAIARVGVYRRDGAARFLLKASGAYEPAGALLRAAGRGKAKPREAPA